LARGGDDDAQGGTPDEPTFFVDRSLGRSDVPAALRGAGARVEIHDDHFPQDAPDVSWLAEAGARGWLVLTKDRRIQRHPLELNALSAAGVGAFILTSANLSGAQMAAALVKALPRMIALAARCGRPFVATVSRSGDVSLKEPAKGRRR
jgi:hypothetical protein